MNIYRCTNCGKWSHAKRMPKKHQRTVWEGGPEYDPALNENDGYDHMNGFHPGAHYVDCGPFEEWVAIPRVQFDAMVDEYIGMM